MHITYSNRALGILYSFLKHHTAHLDIWLFPAHICFSVSFLFLNLGEKIIFYDYVFSIDTVLKPLNSLSKPVGLLLVDYYGKAWEHENLKLFREYSACLIHDVCLGVPCTSHIENSIADLTIFSTGKGKVVELGFGAFGISREKIPLSMTGRQQSVKLFTNQYEALESYWKDIIKGKAVFDLGKLRGGWIDTSNTLIKHNFLRELEETKKNVLAHKEKLNSIYQALIPEELHSKELSNIWRYNIFVKNKEILLKAIFDEGLFASSHYVNASKYLPAFSQSNTNTNADFIEKYIINLFNDFYFSEEKAKHCALIINKLFNQGLISSVKSTDDESSNLTV
jgi:hypothetical protein